MRDKADESEEEKEKERKKTKEEGERVFIIIVIPCLPLSQALAENSHVIIP